MVERGADSSIRRYDPDGIDPETPGVPSEGNAIQYAIFAKHVSVVAYLLEQRPDLLPGLLTYAALYGAENVVEYLFIEELANLLSSFRHHLAKSLNKSYLRFKSSN